MNELEKAEEELRSILRKYPTDKLLEYISNKSMKIDLDQRGVVFEKNIMYSQWELTQLSYYSIKYSNDYRNINYKINEKDFYILLNANRKYDNCMENIKDMNKIKILEHMQCLTNVQFDYQQNRMISRFNRMYKILIDINQNKEYIKDTKIYINFDEKFKEITGIEICKFIKIYLLIILFIIKIKDNEVLDIYNIIKGDIEKIGITEKECLMAIEYYSKNYEYYRDCNNWNSLKFYPIVKTNKNEKYILTNIGSFMISFPDIEYWIIRNYYKEQGSRDFTSYFGECFEIYLKEMFEFYNINAEKLKEDGKNKIPDWRIETKKYTILVEQKAALFPIDARVTTSENRYDAIEKYFENIKKAFEQLNSFQIENNNKMIIRICLTYETIHMIENAQDIIREKMEFSNEIYLNWILNIDEFENLMELLNQSEEEFENIIEKKINLEKIDSNDGKSFEAMFEKLESDYVREEINYFNHLIKEILKKHSQN